MPSIFKALCGARRSESREGLGEQTIRNPVVGQCQAVDSTEEFNVYKHLDMIEDLGQTMAALHRVTILNSTPSPALVARKSSPSRKNES
jgi:hypothetical protein